jgi:DNA-binding NtrC family response regulator
MRYRTHASFHFKTYMKMSQFVSRRRMNVLDREAIRTRIETSEANMNAPLLMISSDDEIMSSLGYYFRNIYQIDTTSNAEQGLAMLKTGKYGVVLYDDEMLPAQGVHFLNRIYRAAPRTARILLVEHSENSTAKEMKRSKHAFQCIIKPCTLHALERGIRMGLEEYWGANRDQDRIEVTANYYRSPVG